MKEGVGQVLTRVKDVSSCCINDTKNASCSPKLELPLMALYVCICVCICACARARLRV